VVEVNVDDDFSLTLFHTGGESLQEELLPLKSGVPAGVAMLSLPLHNRRSLW
jgi:hypothetical protein